MKYTNSLILSKTEPEIMIQIFHKKVEELKESVKEIKKILEKEIKSLHIMFIEQEKDFNLLPDLEEQQNLK